MKPNPKIILLFLTLAVTPGAFAQSNRVPGPTDYESFSRFIADRNIFDPNRYPHNTGTRIRVRTRTHLNSSTPFLALVGIMSYDKGQFAFFNGNEDSRRQVLTVSGQIENYTVTEVDKDHVKLVSQDKKQTLDLKVGDVLRQENGQWELSDERDVPQPAEATAPAAPTTPAAPAADQNNDDSSNTQTPTTPAEPTSASEPNDILKRLMQLREKENQ